MLPFRDLFIWLTIYRSDDKEKFLEPLPLEKDLLFTFVGTEICVREVGNKKKSLFQGDVINPSFIN